MKEKRNVGSIVTIIILALIAVSLGTYIVIDKKLIDFNNISKKENNTEKEEIKKEKSTKLDISNYNVISLFEGIHKESITPDNYLYAKDELTVDSMEEEYKQSLALVQTEPVKVGENTKVFKEDDIEKTYEKIFGQDTYNKAEQIKYISDITLNYNEEDEGYKLDKDIGGTSMDSICEKIISANKYTNRIEITSVVAYLDLGSNAFYKDFEKKEKVADANLGPNTTETADKREDTIDDFITKNSDKLNKYTYTFNLNKDGFYYFNKISKTN